MYDDSSHVLGHMKQYIEDTVNTSIWKDHEQSKSLSQGGRLVNRACKPYTKLKRALMSSLLGRQVGDSFTK